MIKSIATTNKAICQSFILKKKNRISAYGLKIAVKIITALTDAEAPIRWVLVKLSAKTGNILYALTNNNPPLKAPKRYKVKNLLPLKRFRTIGPNQYKNNIFHNI